MEFSPLDGATLVTGPATNMLEIDSIAEGSGAAAVELVPTRFYQSGGFLGPPRVTAACNSASACGSNATGSSASWTNARCNLLTATPSAMPFAFYGSGGSMSGTSMLPIEYYSGNSGSASHDYEGQSHAAAAATYLDGSSTAAATVYVAPAPPPLLHGATGYNWPPQASDHYFLPAAQLEQFCDPHSAAAASQYALHYGTKANGSGCLTARFSGASGATSASGLLTGATGANSHNVLNNNESKTVFPPVAGEQIVLPNSSTNSPLNSSSSKSSPNFQQTPSPDAKGVAATTSSGTLAGVNDYFAFRTRSCGSEFVSAAGAYPSPSYLSLGTRAFNGCLSSATSGASGYALGSNAQIINQQHSQVAAAPTHSANAPGSFIVNVPVQQYMSGNLNLNMSYELYNNSCGWIAPCRPDGSPLDTLLVPSGTALYTTQSGTNLALASGVVDPTAALEGSPTAGLEILDEMAVGAETSEGSTKPRKKRGPKLGSKLPGSGKGSRSSRASKRQQDSGEE